MKPWHGAVLMVVVAFHAGAVAVLRTPGVHTAPALTPPLLEISLMAAPTAVTPAAPPVPERSPERQPDPKPHPRPKPRPKPVSHSRPRPSPTAPPQATIPTVAATPTTPAASPPVATATAAAPHTASSPELAAATAPAPVRAPAAIACRTPAYPTEARRRGESGTVLLGLLVSVDGSVVDHRLERSSGFPALDQAALAALSKCRFKPGTVDGRPHASWARLRYVWKLE